MLLNQINALGAAALKLHREGKFKEALALCEQIVNLSPGHADALNLIGAILIRLDRPQDASDYLNRAVSVRPTCGAALTNRGIALRMLEMHDEALLDFESATRAEPSLALAWAMLGQVLLTKREEERAWECLKRAIELDPYDQDALAYAGICRENLDDPDEALNLYRRALELQPIPNIEFNAALKYLQLGDYRQGWRLYEARWAFDRPGVPIPSFDEPLWLGRENINGTTMLLHSEQGLGDTIQFCRFATLVAALGAKVIVETYGVLVDLLRTVPGVDLIIERGQARPIFDYQCPMMSLPLALGIDLENLPAPAAYLAADMHKVTKWKSRMAPSALRVGIAWSGNPHNTRDLKRSIPFADFIRDLPVDPAIEYISLLNAVRESDVEAIKSRPDVRHFCADLTDFSETAALCSVVDIVIAVDTSLAHLAGALGVPVLVLVPINPDWRWMLNRKDSPWYPSATVFRQETKGDWRPVMQEVGTAITCLSQSRKRRSVA